MVYSQTSMGSTSLVELGTVTIKETNFFIGKNAFSKHSLRKKIFSVSMNLSIEIIFIQKITIFV